MYKFHLKERSRGEKVFLVLKFMGGDADTFETEEIEIDTNDFTPSEFYVDEEFQALIDKYKIIKGLQNDESSHKMYDILESKYGEEIANLYDNIPGDPQTYGEFKCSLQWITIRGYDYMGNMYEAEVD
jgi:hypothetical protein